MRFLKICVVVFVCCGEFTIAATPPISIGAMVNSGTIDLIQKSNKHGSFDHAVVYRNVPTVKNWDTAYKQVQKILDKGFAVTLVVSFHEKGNMPNLERIKEGKYDDALNKLARVIVADGRPVKLRPMHECFNGSWYSCGRYMKGNKSSDFIPAFRHVVGTLCGVPGMACHEKVLIDLNVNRKSAGNRGVSDFSTIALLEDEIDIVSISTFNRCGLSESHIEWRSFAEEFAPAYHAVTKVSPKKPIAVAETGTTGLCGGNKAQWITDLFRSVADHFPRVIEVTVALHTVKSGKASNNRDAHWEMENDAQKSAFTGGVEYLRRKRTRAQEMENDAVQSRISGSPQDAKIVILEEEWWAAGQWRSSMYYKLRHTFGAEPVPGFGEPGTHLFFAARSCGKNDADLSICVGMDGNASDNKERFWQNSLEPHLGVEKRWKDGNGFTALGSRIKYVNYFRGNPHPEERDGDWMTEIYISGYRDWN